MQTEISTSHNNGINWLGFRTLYLKEVRRFLKVYNQTLIAPAVTAMLFLAIFTLAIGSQRPDVMGVPFHQFMIPGLIMMTMMQNAFANTSSSLTMGKVLGVIIDILLPPLSAGEITAAMLLGGVTRGIMCGIMVAGAAALFVPLSVHDWGMLLLYSILANSLLALLGILAGIISDSFDQMSAITSYIITPLSFLSGTFYSVKMLPEFWQIVNSFNPFFYIIDGFRYAMTGHADASLNTGLWVLVVSNIVLFIIAYSMFARGYRIKS